MSDMNPVGWFEIPVRDTERAKTFYEKVFGFEMKRNDAIEGAEMVWFPMDGKLPGAAGALMKMDKWYTPSQDGPLIYFSAPSGDLNVELQKALDAGGKILQEKKSIGEHGFVGFFKDSEGNRIALHSMK